MLKSKTTGSANFTSWRLVKDGRRRTWADAARMSLLNLFSIRVKSLEEVFGAEPLTERSDSLWYGF